MLLRHTILTDKEEVFNLLEKPEISKVQLRHGKNYTLRDPNVANVDVYYNKYRNDVRTVLGHLEKASENLDPSGSAHGFLNGLASAKRDGFLKASQIVKLNNIADKHGLNLAISSRLLNFAKKLKQQQEY